MTGTLFKPYMLSIQPTGVMRPRKDKLLSYVCNYVTCEWTAFISLIHLRQVWRMGIQTWEWASHSHTHNSHIWSHFYDSYQFGIVLPKNERC